MASGLFVTGTDTGVGKTVVSAALVALYRARGPVCYWKPVQTGVEQDDDTSVVAHLAAYAPEEVLREGVRLPRPISPHLAARRAGTTLTLASIVEPMSRRLSPPTPFWIIEGAGGAYVPINDEHMMVDLMVMLGLPVVVVARTAVGTINHTLLTLEALRRRALDVAAVVMSGAPDAGAREAIAQFGAVPIVELPVMDPPGPEAIARWAAQAGASWPI